MTDNEEPTFGKPLKLRDEPSGVNSRTAIELPTRDTPIREKEDPKRA
jgi:hypothetical protein